MDTRRAVGTSLVNVGACGPESYNDSLFVPFNSVHQRSPPRCINSINVSACLEQDVYRGVVPAPGSQDKEGGSI